MFWHLFKYRLKVLLGSRSVLFWMIAFPFILGTLFNFAFSELGDRFDAPRIGLVSEVSDDSNFVNLVEGLGYGDDRTFDVERFYDVKTADERLKSGEIEGYYLVTPDETENLLTENIEVVIRTNGIAQTMMKFVADNYYQTVSAIGHLVELNPEKFREDTIDKLNQNKNFLREESTGGMDFVNVYFYTLIGMACIYSAVLGMMSVNETEANLSRRAMRTSIAPVHKAKMLFASLLASLLIHFTGVLLLVAYLAGVLGVDFGNYIWLIILLVFVGDMAGLTFGLLVGSATKGTETAKTNMIVSITMLLCFLAGMMVITMKYLISKNVPILAAINPVAMITDGFYSLYYYGDFSRYVLNVVGLLAFSLVMFGISFLFIRRKKYASL